MRLGGTTTTGTVQETRAARQLGGVAGHRSVGATAGWGCGEVRGGRRGESRGRTGLRCPRAAGRRTRPPGPRSRSSGVDLAGAAWAGERRRARARRSAAGWGLPSRRGPSPGGDRWRGEPGASRAGLCWGGAQEARLVPVCRTSSTPEGAGAGRTRVGWHGMHRRLLRTGAAVGDRPGSGAGRAEGRPGVVRGAWRVPLGTPGGGWPGRGGQGRRGADRHPWRLSRARGGGRRESGAVRWTGLAVGRCGTGGGRRGRRGARGRGPGRWTGAPVVGCGRCSARCGRPGRRGAGGRAGWSRDFGCRGSGCPGSGRCRRLGARWRLGSARRRAAWAAAACGGSGAGRSVPSWGSRRARRGRCARGVRCRGPSLQGTGSQGTAGPGTGGTSRAHGWGRGARRWTAGRWGCPGWVGVIPAGTGCWGCWGLQALQEDRDGRRAAGAGWGPRERGLAERWWSGRDERAAMPVRCAPRSVVWMGLVGERCPWSGRELRGLPGVGLPEADRSDGWIPENGLHWMVPGASGPAVLSPAVLSPAGERRATRVQAVQERVMRGTGRLMLWPLGWTSPPRTSLRWTWLGWSAVQRASLLWTSLLGTPAALTGPGGDDSPQWTALQDGAVSPVAQPPRAGHPPHR